MPADLNDLTDDAEHGRVDPATVVAAMRLAVVGRPDDDAATLAMLRDLLDCAEETPQDDVRGPALLVARITAGKYRLIVIEEGGA